MKRQEPNESARPRWFTGGRSYRFRYLTKLLFRSWIARKYLYSPDRIRVFLITRDLYSSLLPLINRCISAGIEKNNIFVVDQGSTNPRCTTQLAALSSRGVNIIKIPPNAHIYGPYVLWEDHELSTFIGSIDYPYIVSDTDLSFPDCCPDDWLLQMFRRINTYPFLTKISLSLRTSDIDVINCKQIIKHEENLGKSLVYKGFSRISQEDKEIRFCQTDTTFSLYRPGLEFSTISCRLSYPYELNHLPWYKKYISTDEYNYYRRHKITTFGMWS